MLPVGFDRYHSIFFPFAAKKVAEASSRRTRFVHYTSAEVGASIIKNREVWMRNATTLNDFSEIEYGFECVNSAYKGEIGGQFKKALDGIFPGFSSNLELKFNEWLPHIRVGTYMTCISEHLESEDKFGRLSMWRAYGGVAGVAIVINGEVFQTESEILSVYSSPVAYLSKEQAPEYLLSITNNMLAEVDLIRSEGPEKLHDSLFNMLQFAVMSTKHPGFHEEREWRLIHSPTFGDSEKLVRSIETVRGVPQVVYKIPLRDEKEHGLVNVELPKLIERIIIGPTQFPAVIWDAFVRLLTDAGVPDAEKRVLVSDIPLRHKG